MTPAIFVLFSLKYASYVVVIDTGSNVTFLWEKNKALGPRLYKTRGSARKAASRLRRGVTH